MADQETLAMRKMFVGGLNRDTKEETLRSHFSQNGTIEELAIIRDPITNASLGFGFITFQQSESVEHVFQSRPHHLDGKTLDVKRAVPNDSDDTGAHNQTTKLFIGGISPELQFHELEDYLYSRHPKGSILEIVSIDFIKGRETNQNKAFGFMEVATTDQADRLSICENSFTLNGRNMSITKAETAAGSDGSSSGCRGGGRGGLGGGARGGARGGYGAGGYGTEGGYGGVY